VTRREWVRVARRRTRLSLAVRPVDVRTGETERGSVTLREHDAAPSRHRSGHYLFLDLPGDPATVTVEVDAPGYRTVPHPAVLPPPLPDDVEADPDPDPDPERPGLPATRPVVEVGLFPPDATLVYGQVTDADGVVAGATVSVSGVELSTTTDESGGYVLFFDGQEGLAEADGPDGQRVLTVDGGTPELVADADADDPASPSDSQQVVVSVGRVASLDFALE
jgi:hypothetical protein